MRPNLKMNEIKKNIASMKLIAKAPDNHGLTLKHDFEYVVGGEVYAATNDHL